MSGLRSRSVDEEEGISPLQLLLLTLLGDMALDPHGEVGDLGEVGDRSGFQDRRITYSERRMRGGRSGGDVTDAQRARAGVGIGVDVAEVRLP